MMPWLGVWGQVSHNYHHNSYCDFDFETGKMTKNTGKHPIFGLLGGLFGVLQKRSFVGQKIFCAPIDFFVFVMP